MATAAEPARGRFAAFRSSAVVALARLVGRLPEAPLVAMAEASGELWYRLAPRRAAQARLNLARVSDHLAASGRGSALARRAAADPDALERLVRATFRHTARYYLEVARAGSYDVPTALDRMTLETPGEIEAAFAGGRPVVILGGHFGAIELPAVYIAHRLGHVVTAPMETVDDPVLQRWFVESRSRVGVHIIPLTDARRRLLAALRSGESVGLVVDRDLTGKGIQVPLFGHPAPISPGPAVLALQAGVDVYVGGARRTRDNRYRCRLVRVSQPGPGSRRERIVAMTQGIAQALESIIAEAPEQWWGSFHPIWPDLEAGAAGEAA